MNTGLEISVSSSRDAVCLSGNAERHNPELSASPVVRKTAVETGLPTSERIHICCCVSDKTFLADTV